MSEVRVGPGGRSVEGSVPVLRSALSLACATRLPLRWDGYRRRSGGFDEGEALLVRCFAELTGASWDGGHPGASELRFAAGDPVSGPHEIALPGREALVPLVGAVTVPLAGAGVEAEVVFRGSTHAPAGASYETLGSTWLYLMRQAGLDLDVALVQAGFAPRGGGEIRLTLRKGGIRSGLLLGAARELESVRIVSAGARLPAHVQQRQAARARSGVQIAGLEASVQLLKLRSDNAGSVVAITGSLEGLPVTVSAVPARSRPVESAGEEAASEFRQMISSRAIVPPALMEPLLLAAAMASGSSSLTTWRLPAEIPAQAELVREFTGRKVGIEGKPGRPALLRID